MVMPIALLFLMSVLAGFVGSIGGVGGGIILIPILTLAGVDIKQAIAVSTISTIAISVSATTTYLRRHMPNLNADAFLAVFALAGAWIGALITVASTWRTLSFACGIIFLVYGLLLLRKGGGLRTSAVSQDAFSKWLRISGSYYDDAEGRTIAYQGTRSFLVGPLVFFAGLISGSLGFGGSGLVVLTNQEVLGLPIKVALSTSHLIIAIMALVGAEIYLEAGLLDSTLTTVVLFGASLGALVGARLLVHLENRIIRAILMALLFIFGIEMIFREIR